MSPRRATQRRWIRPVLGTVALAGLTLGLSGCSQELNAQIRRLAIPESASVQAEPIARLWVGTWIAAFSIGVLVLGLIVFAAVRFQGRDKTRLPRQSRYNLPMEIMYTLVPFVILGVLFYYTVLAQTTVLKKVPDPAHTIDVVGQKWSWTFNYLEQDNAAVGNNVYEAGTISHSPDLYVPVDETIQFNLSSPDVIHAFWIPAFHFKMDIIPGRNNNFQVTPNRIGVYKGLCTQLCGTYHSAMIFRVHVVSKADYETYLKGLAARGNVGIAKGGQYTTTIEQNATSEGNEDHGFGPSGPENAGSVTQEGGQ